MSLIARADGFAAGAHAGQFRKYTGERYVEHPRAVAALLNTLPLTYAADVDVMRAAALLHDVVEDTRATLDDVLMEFGPAVARLVDQLTEPLTTGNRAERKARETLRLAACCPEAQTIKCADLIDNARSIREHDAKFWPVYRAEAVALLLAMPLADVTLRAELAERLA